MSNTFRHVPRIPLARNALSLPSSLPSSRFFLHAPRARTHARLLADRATSFPSLISALVLTGLRQHKDTTKTTNWSSFAGRGTGYVHPFQVQLKSFGKSPAVDVVAALACRRGGGRDRGENVFPSMGRIARFRCRKSFFLGGEGRGYVNSIDMMRIRG